jgi:hypothetical protein
MIDKFKTRIGKLEHNIKVVMDNEYPKVGDIISAVESYEQDNINTIEKLKRGKRVEMNRINGALKQSINAHGAITKELIGSCSKRIFGSLMENHNQDEQKEEVQKEQKNIKVSLRDILIGVLIGAIATSVILIIL